MVHRIHGLVTFECDTCGQQLDTETRDWNVALTQMRESGWSARKIGQDWIHACDECQNDHD